jgi:hypothetical protein
MKSQARSALSGIAVAGGFVIISLLFCGCASEYPGFSSDPVNTYKFNDNVDAVGGWHPQVANETRLPDDWLDRRPPDYWFQSPGVWK